MSFYISYSDESGLNVYAILFDCEDVTRAWDKTLQAFSVFSLENQDNFVLPLIEYEQRKGFYIYEFTSDLAGVKDSTFYLIEVWKKQSSNYDRENDTFMGDQQFFWNGHFETYPFYNIPPFDVSDIWTYENRSLTSSLDPTAKEIWEYVDRTLTSMSISDSDKEYIKNMIDSSIKNMIDNSIINIVNEINNIKLILDNVSQSAEKAYAVINVIKIIVESLKSLSTHPTSVIAQSPRIASSTPVQSNIRVN